jgi:Rieske Fe-S protein
MPPAKQEGCSRRCFCMAAGAGLAALTLPSCDGGTTPVGGPDLKPGTPPPQGGDLAQGGADMAHLSSCAGKGSVMAGPATAIGLDQSMRLTDYTTYDLYLCRDSGGLFTVDASCTHAGATIRQQGQGWFCPRHGATFSFDGQNPTYPAFSPLNNYAVCVDTDGNVVIDPNTVVSPTTRV